MPVRAVKGAVFNTEVRGKGGETRRKEKRRRKKKRKPEECKIQPRHGRMRGSGENMQELSPPSPESVGEERWAGRKMG